MTKAGKEMITRAQAIEALRQAQTPETLEEWAKKDHAKADACAALSPDGETWFTTRALRNAADNNLVLANNKRIERGF